MALYNHQLPQSALKSKTPMQAMKEWHQSHPQLFHKRPYDRPGCDNYRSRAAALGDHHFADTHHFLLAFYSMATPYSPLSGSMAVVGMLPQCI